jgi:hypothetical protein
MLRAIADKLDHLADRIEYGPGGGRRRHSSEEQERHE